MKLKLLAAMVVLVVASLGLASSASARTNCGELRTFEFVLYVSAKNSTCSRARAVVRSFVYHSEHWKSRSNDAYRISSRYPGWRCANNSNNDGGRCKKQTSYAFWTAVGL
jgi:hypothetical protein